MIGRMADRGTQEAMEGSPPKKFLGEAPIPGGRSGAVEGELDRASGGKVGLDGTTELRVSWMGPAWAQVSWTGPAEVRKWTGPAEKHEWWTGGQRS